MTNYKYLCFLKHVSKSPSFLNCSMSKTYVKEINQLKNLWRSEAPGIYPARKQYKLINS